MKKENYQFSFEVYDSVDELSEQDAWLLREAQEVTSDAYAPYSNFQVGLSYDMTISKLREADPRPKTFEISLILRGDRRNEGVIWCPWK